LTALAKDPRYRATGRVNAVRDAAAVKSARLRAATLNMPLVSDEVGEEVSEQVVEEAVFIV
jgi:hypothetical protein